MSISEGVGLGLTLTIIKKMNMDSTPDATQALSLDSDKTSPKNYCLLVGSGSQACQGP